MTRTRLLAVGAVAVVALVVALFGFASAAFAQVPPFEVGNVCVADYPVDPINCTAQDFGLKQLRPVQILEVCSGGTVGEFEVVFDAVLSSAGPDRYDVGLFIDRSGSPDGALLGDDCLHGYLAPPFTTSPTYVNDPLNPNSVGLDTILYGPWWNGETGVPTDQCGDMESSTHAVIRLERLRLPCVDNDGDGFVDIHTCGSYRNNRQWECTDVTGAFPDTPSKCGCAYFNFPFQPSAIELASFSAAAQGGDVLLSWETGSELDNLGFNLFRAGSPDGEQVRINERLIPSQATGNAVGASYSFLDDSVVAGQTYYYWLQDVDTDGVINKNGPIEVVLRSARALPGRPRPVPIPVGVR
jgi:hypothetical protein